jgi:diketogulonate reductase-like aldo/keto reductase
LENVTTLSGVTMPSLIYGTAWKKDRTADLVTQAIKLGFRGIDTACQPKHYNESGVGEALERLTSDNINRESLFVQTKFTPIDGQDPLTIPYNKNAPLSEQVFQSFEVSKKNLKLNYVDSLILHSPFENVEKLMIAWGAMEGIYQQKGTKQLGISNCYDLEVLKFLYKKASVKPATVQNRFYHQTNYDIEIRKWCVENKIIYQSFWTLTANPDLLNNILLRDIAHTYQKTEAQILFRFLTQTNIIPLIGACSENHLKEDLDIFNFKLPQSLIQQIGLLIHAI